MSAGAFNTNARYLDNGGLTRRIRVQPETLLLVIDGTANAQAPAAALTPPSAAVSKGRRTIGVNARLVRIKFSSTLPDGYKADQVIALPWLVRATFDAFAGGETGTYLGNPIELVGVTGEARR